MQVNMMMRAVVVALAITAVVAGCTVNGRAIGLPGGSSSSSSSSPPTQSSATGEAAGGDPASGEPEAPAGFAGSAPGSTCKAQMYADPWPYLDRPADPWLAVVDGKPARMSLPTDRSGMMKENPTAVCDAAHDHCLRDCSWLVADASDRGRTASVLHVDAGGKFRHEDDGNPAPDGFVAYRTVPVTRKNLAVGALVVANPDGVWDGKDPSTHNSGYHHFLHRWSVGTVASIDWASGVVWLQGYNDAFFLSASRVAVLRYSDEGGVVAMPGVEAKAPAVADVIAPGRPAAVSDPWSQVGKDHQPLTSNDSSAMAALAQPCPAKFDHCLRPWVWFVDDGGQPAPARWTGKGFVRATDADFAIDKPGLAYRTRPAKEAELRPGTRILVYRDTYHGPSSQRDAHETRNNWTFAEVDVVDPNFHVFTIRGSTNSYPADNARLLVLYWLAGEPAAAVE